MADNVSITAGSGTSIATDDIAGVQVQRVKSTWGPDGTANDTDIASGKPIPVQLRGSDGTDRSNSLPVAATLQANSGVDIGKLTANQSTNVAQLAGTTTDTNSGTKSAGTLRVVLATDQPALTNKLLVTPDSVALPSNQSVNISQINAVTPLMGNGVTGTGSQRVTIASDNTAFPIKIASGGIASGAIASGAVASGAIASGAIAVGAIAAGATSIADNEDAASADGDRGIKILGVRKATPANTSGTDGDYEMFQMSAGRLWTSSDMSIAGTAVDGNSGNKSAQTMRVVLATDQPALTNKLLVTPDANSAVNVAQINGVTTLMGNGATGTGSQRVTIASDNTPYAVKIDQTTPGTTNLVYSVGSRPGIVTSTLSATTTYTTVGTVIGGLLTFSTGLPSGTILFSPTFRLIMPTAQQSVNAPTLFLYWFHANPTSSTTTDNAVINLNSADYSKLTFGNNAQANGNISSTTGASVFTGAGPSKIVVDGSGNIYLVLATFSGNFTTVSPPQTMQIRIEYQY